MPSSNVVYADIDGNIGYAMSSRLPVCVSGDGGMLALQNDRRRLAADAILEGVEEAMTMAQGRRDGATAVAVLNLLAKWDRVVDARPVV